MTNQKKHCFSIEYFKELGIKGKHSYVVFHPNSTSYIKFGRDAHLIVEVTDELKREYLQRIKDADDSQTYGLFQAQVCVAGSDDYKQAIVNTEDIYSVDNLK